MKNKVCFVLLLFLLPTLCPAQALLDSAFRQLYSKDERAVMHTARFLFLIETLERIAKNRHDSLLGVVVERLEREVINRDNVPSFTHTVACVMVGSHYFNKKQNEKGFLYFDRAEKENKGLRNRALHFLYERNTGNYQGWHRLDSALVYAEREIEIAREIDDDTLVFYSSYRLGGILYGINNYLKARQVLLFVAHHNLQGKDFLRTVYNTIALSYQKQAIQIQEAKEKHKHFDSARAYYDTAYYYASLYPKDFFWKGLIRGNIGDSYFFEEKYDIAIPYLHEDLASTLRYHKGKVTENAIFNINRLMASYIHLGKMDSAKIFKDSLERNIYKVNKPSITKDFYETSALYFRKKGDFTNAFAALNRYLIFSDSMNKVENITNANQLEGQLTTDYKRKQVLEELEKQKEENKRTNGILISISFIVLLLLVLIYALYRLNRDKVKVNGLLNLQKADISAKNGKLNQINEELKNTLEVVANQNEAISTQTRKLTELNQLKDKLFSIISHDLRSPLGAMKGVLSILEMGGLSDAELQIISKDIKKRLDGLDYTLNNLLVWSKAQMSGEMSIKENIDLQQLMNGKINLFANNAEAKHIRLVNLVPENSYVYADLNHLRVVLRNLIGNAIKFTPEGGKIELIVIESVDFVRIGIRDSGVGMTKEQINKLFNRNTHFTTRGTKDEKGTGLGLLLSQEFVEKDGGRIWVESKEGEGSTFFVELPKA